MYWCRLVLQFLLFVLFFSFFGLESLKRYWKYEVVELHSEKRLGGLPVPAVTFCPMNPSTSIGYRTHKIDLEGVLNGKVLDMICKNKMGIELKKCVQEEAFDLSTAITSVSTKPYETEHDLDESLWAPHFSYTLCGLCFTYNSSLKLGVDLDTSRLFFTLNESLSYVVFFHDPNLLVLNFNPDMPMTQMTYYKPWQIRRMKVVQHEKLNVPTKPCNTDPDYSFTGCVRKALSMSVGCRLPWDQWTSTDVPLCTTVDQFR